MSLDVDALTMAISELEHAISDAISNYENLLEDTVTETEFLRTLQTDSLRSVVDSKTVKASRAAAVEARRQSAAHAVSSRLGLEPDATISEIVDAIPAGLDRSLGGLTVRLFDVVGKLRRANERNRTIAMSGIHLTSNLISALAPESIPVMAYSGAGGLVSGGRRPIIEYTG